MEKICLVKLRKKIINPCLSRTGQGFVSQGRPQEIPRQFGPLYGQKEIATTGISDGGGEERVIPQGFVSPCTTDDAVVSAPSVDGGVELEAPRQFVVPCAYNDLIPQKTAQVITLADTDKATPRETVALTLTQEQIKTIRSSPRLLSVFEGELRNGSAELTYSEKPITIKFEVEPLAPIRMLMAEEVVQMLRISNGFLKTIVRDGRLKSYKVGKGRRYMLEDVLTYLTESLSTQNTPSQESAQAETI
ncbi:MAG: helix-turn-helix domain-containing protein [Syntrophales bacterium]